VIMASDIYYTRYELGVETPLALLTLLEVELFLEDLDRLLRDLLLRTGVSPVDARVLPAGVTC
jgi:hypothetical protein